MSAAPSPTPRVRREPYLRVGRTRRRLACKLARGASPEVAGAALHIGPDELQAILGEEEFQELVASYRELRLLPRDELIARLEDVAQYVLLELMEERHPGVCAWFFHHSLRKRDPVAVLAGMVADSLERLSREPATPPPRRRPKPRAYDDIDALRHRISAYLRAVVLAEHGARLRAAPETSSPPASPRPDLPEARRAPTMPSAPTGSLTPEPVHSRPRHDTS
ncbi:MAG: hypothetical protein U1E45_07410 [Geminicoccaceae bacterium]